MLNSKEKKVESPFILRKNRKQWCDLAPEVKSMYPARVFSKLAIINASRGKKYLTETVTSGRNYSSKRASITAIQYTVKE